MSAKAKALFKKLRSKANEEKLKEKNEEFEIRKAESNPIAFNNKFLSDLQLEKKEKEIDPLDYFKTEHIKIEPDDMNEYNPLNEINESSSDENTSLSVRSNKNEKKEKNEKNHKNKNNKNNNNNEPIYDLKTGIMGPTSHKINFMEMMKARNKIKKTQTVVEDDKKRKNLSVEPRTKKKGDEAINEVEEEEKKEKKIKVRSVGKDPIDSTKNLYVKLILARNRFSQNNIVTEENVYQNIMNLVDEFNAIKDLPKEISDEVNNLLKKLELPHHLIIDNDVQDYIPEDQFVPLIPNPINLDEMIKKLNITGN